MTKSHFVEEMQTLPRPKGVLDFIITRVEQISIAIASVAIFALMMTAVFQVFARYAFNAPIRGYIDYVEQASAILAFAAVGYAEHLGAHIRMEFVPQHLSGRARKLLESFCIFIGLFLIAALIYACWFNFLRAWQLGDSTMDVELLTWPSKLLVPVAFAFLWLRMCITLVRELFGPDDTLGETLKNE
jgi:TRAP-type C4-dicarboxylate transport system permease small subunit